MEQWADDHALTLASCDKTFANGAER
jgi:hypothetical protein